MSLWSSLFGKKNTTEANQLQPNSVADNLPGSNINVLEDLFIDPTPPAEEAMSKARSISLSSFIDRDYNRKGHEDGYSWHSTQMLDSQVKSLKAEFRYFLDQKIDEIRQQILLIQGHQVELTGLSERMKDKLQLRIDLMNVNIQRLEKEKELSAQDEGLVMKVVNEYRDGFIRGMERYQEEKLFCGSTGLFI